VSEQGRRLKVSVEHDSWGWAQERASDGEANILLEWRCEACNWRVVLPAPGFAGDGYVHWLRDDTGCGPLVARRVGGWARLPPGASPEEIEEALESTR
jgi:hypothetical protein